MYYVQCGKFGRKLHIFIELLFYHLLIFIPHTQSLFLLNSKTYTVSADDMSTVDMLCIL